MPTCHVVSLRRRVDGECGDRRGPQRTVRRLLRGEDRRVDDDVAGRDGHGRAVRCHDRHEVVVRPAPGQGRQVVRPIDGRAVVGVVRPGMTTVRIRASTRRLSWAATRSTDRRGWTLLSNRSPAIRSEVDLLREGEVDGRDERRELTLALGRSLLAKVVVSRAEMDVSGVDDPEHPPGVSPPCQHGLRWQRGSEPWSASDDGGCERGAPMTPRPLPRILVAPL